MANYTEPKFIVISWTRYVRRRLHNEHLKIQSAPWEGRFLKLYYDFGQNVIFYFYLGVENLRQINEKFAFFCVKLQVRSYFNSISRDFSNK